MKVWFDSLIDWTPPDHICEECKTPLLYNDAADSWYCPDVDNCPVAYEQHNDPYNI